MKNLRCAICGRDIKRKKAKRRFCIVCLEKKARQQFKKKMLRGIASV